MDVKATRILRSAGVTRVIVYKRMVVADSAVGAELQAKNFLAALVALQDAGMRFEMDLDFPMQAMLVR